MPRIARALADNQIYHIVNRGNRRESVFHDTYDFEKFLGLLRDSKEKYGLRIFAYCLMPNHFHLVVCATKGDGLSAAMHWICSSYVRYYNKRYSVSGHLWQGRYKSFVVQQDSYLLTLLKYVEANPLRAGIVDDATIYKYGSAYERVYQPKIPLLDAPAIELPDDWRVFVNIQEKDADLHSIRNALNRQSPLGEQEWALKIAKEYGLESTLNNRGRPRKEREENER